MIRPARPADRPRLRAIQTVSLAEPWPELLETAVDGAGVVRVVTAPDASGTTADTAVDAASGDTDQPVGYAVALPKDEAAYLAEIAVAPAHRRQGHGSHLLGDLLAGFAAEGFERAWLTVRVDDRGARAFYETHDFRVRALLPHHYEDGDGLELVRPLQ
ncbi:GNAT family N-acetyltransferase [Halorientalis marina]|uniref:GNAT family N-acetyltransferase n=1 Tax=Halorientalis marina TaxID=2931976 RepID=UPI001FF1F9D1|nr:N-acetyltransferase [Halorientalis marina]